MAVFKMRSPPGGPRSPPMHATPCKKRCGVARQHAKPQEPPQAAAPEVDIDAIWDDAIEMRDALAVDDSEDEHEDYAQSRRPAPVMATLPCGTVHVCVAGRACPYLVCNEDRLLVCEHTGVEHGSEAVDEFFDLCGGIGKKSGDPDANCGELVHGKFSKRVDPLQASRRAFEEAEAFGEDDVCAFINPVDAMAVRAPKRGALCVGESPDESAPKRSRSSKKNVTNRATTTNLLAEAQSVFGKLINFDRCSSFNKGTDGERVDRKRPQSDPRLQDEAFVRTVSTKRYLKACLADGRAPCIDDIHNIGLQAQKLAAEARENAHKVDHGQTIRTAKFRNAISSLIVALWVAVCASPYMLNNPKRGTDAFRPFVCGVLYATKRGLKLEDGTWLVPKIDILNSALPVLRGTGGNLQARTLHSSSHRGMCTLSRCVSSVPKQEQQKVFSQPIRSCAVFLNQRFCAGDI